jgi:dTMP kinase
MTTSADDIENPLFFAIEGLDGSGSTTQTDRLVDRLRRAGWAAVATQEPSDGPVGSLIRQMLSGRLVQPAPDGGTTPVGRETLALLFAADRLDHLESEVKPALTAGRHVVTDRYYHSSFAYQGDPGDGQPLDLRWVRTLNERARMPDVTFFLEAEVDLCLERLSDRGRRDIYENKERLTELRDQYRQVIDALEDEGERIIRIDADQPRESITDEIFETAKGLIEP